MMSRLKNSAGPTSRQASIINWTRGVPGGARSMCLWAFSIMTMAASTMAPMAMAIPPSDMMVELIPSQYIMMKAISTPMGSMTMATSALRRCSRNSKQTRMTIMDSSTSVLSRLATARSIKSPRSYTGTISTPSGNPGFNSSSLARTASMVSNAFSP